MARQPAPENILECRVQPEDSGQRLDLFLALRLKPKGFSRARIKELILMGKAALDGKAALIPKQGLAPGQKVTLEIPPSPETEVDAQEGALKIILEEPDFLVLDKPPGLTVHPCPSCPKDTLVNILIHHFPQLGKIPGLRPGIVHRLDKDTSGLLLVALNEATRLELSEAFAERMVSKEYLALVKGVPAEKQGTINEPIGRHPTRKTRMAVVPGGKEALSEYRVLASGRDFSLLAVKIHTGRTHQIRVHLAHIGHPIWGDAIYGGPCFKLHESGKKAPGPQLARRQMLHAWKLKFRHPGSNEILDLRCPPPPDFMDAIEALTASPLKAIITGLPGCGKSTLLELLAGLGIPCWSADAEVARLYSRGEDGWQMIKGRFGDRFLNSLGNVDKQALFSAIKANPGLRREVESMVHPAVKHRMEMFWKLHAEKNPQPQCLVAEVPLFLEAGWSGEKFEWGSSWREAVAHCTGGEINASPNAPAGDFVLVYVDTPAPLRYERLARRGVPGEDAALLDSWQFPENKKKEACNIVVDNSRDLPWLEGGAKKLLDLLLRLSAARRKQAARLITKSMQG